MRMLKDTKITISAKMKRKIEYLLKEIDVEWSGMALYRINQYNTSGFPLEVELIDFKPLDIGDAVSTEWVAEDSAEWVFELVKRDLDLSETMIGLIHSHHTMSTEFSNVDYNNLMEFAPTENFYFSIIVSTHPDRGLSAAVSWKDQFGIAHASCINAQYITSKPDAEWVDELTILKKKNANQKKNGKLSDFPVLPVDWRKDYIGWSDEVYNELL